MTRTHHFESQQKKGLSWNGGTPKWMVYYGNSRVPPISGNQHLCGPNERGPETTLLRSVDEGVAMAREWHQVTMKRLWQVTSVDISRNHSQKKWAEITWLVVWLPSINYLVGGLVAINFIFPLILGISNHPNWRTHIFQRGGPTTNQLHVQNPKNNFLNTMDQTNVFFQWLAPYAGPRNRKSVEHAEQAATGERHWCTWRPQPSAAMAKKRDPEMRRFTKVKLSKAMVLSANSYILWYDHIHKGILEILKEPHLEGNQLWPIQWRELRHFVISTFLNLPILKWQQRVVSQNSSSWSCGVSSDQVGKPSPPHVGYTVRLDLHGDAASEILAGAARANKSD